MDLLPNQTHQTIFPSAARGSLCAVLSLEIRSVFSKGCSVRPVFQDPGYNFAQKSVRLILKLLILLWKLSLYLIPINWVPPPFLTREEELNEQGKQALNREIKHNRAFQRMNTVNDKALKKCNMTFLYNSSTFFTSSCSSFKTSSLCPPKHPQSPQLPYLFLYHLLTWEQWNNEVSQARLLRTCNNSLLTRVLPFPEAFNGLEQGSTK